MICNFFCEYFFATLRIAWYSSALNFSAVACSGEKPRSSSTFPCVTWVGLLPALFMFFLPCQPRPYCFEPPLRCLEVPSGHLPALFFEAVQDVDHIFDPRQVNDAIPGSLILISQLKNARANRRQGPVVGRSLALLQLPELKSQVLPNAVRERVEHLSGVALPSDGCGLGPFELVAHGKRL